MRQPVSSSPREPALYARSPLREFHLVLPGGLTLVSLSPQDKLEIIDLEGDQQAHVFAFSPNGSSALGAIGLSPSANATFLSELLANGSLESNQTCKRLVKLGLSDFSRLSSVASLWHRETPPGYKRVLSATEAVFAIVVAPAPFCPVDSQLRGSPLRLVVERAESRILLPKPLPSPLGEVVDEFTIAPGTARDYAVKAGQYVQVLDVAGRQCSDFVAFDRRGLDFAKEIELDPTVTRTLNNSAYPAPGLFSRYYDRNMRPMLEVVRDTVGRHDTFALACTARYYEAHGYFGHDNCSDNISRSLEKHGVAGRPGWPAINFFFNTSIDAHQNLSADEPWSRPGDYVLIRAATDLICSSSSCPDDVDPANGWDPTDIHIRIYSEKERFSIAMANRITPDADPVLTRESGFHGKTSQLTKHFAEYRGFWTPMEYDNFGAVQEYYGCRENVAIMDLSALRKFEIHGPDAEALLNYCLTRDIRKLAVGQVVYSAMCYEHGGMLDDGTLLRIGPDAFRWVCGEDYAGVWLREQASKLGLKTWVKSATDQINNVAIQGPRSRELLSEIIWTPGTMPKLGELGWFRFLTGRLNDYDGCPLMVSRTGYTGELGYEIWCHPSDAGRVWDRVWQVGEKYGLVPLGLNALDMLRIEAGLVFAGYEFSDQTDPYEAGIGFCVPLKSKQDDFIGRQALVNRNAHPQKRLVGLELDGNEQAVHGDCVHDGRAQVGVITSATRSPILGRNIALCRLDVNYCEVGTILEIGKLDGQQKRIAARVSGLTAYDPDKSRVRS